MYSASILSLDSIFVISDGSASNTPIMEVFNDMNINASVLFDEGENRWPRRIEDTIVTTQNVADDYIKISAQEYSTSSCFRPVKKAYFH